jgi:hypothetical protein
MIGWHSWAEKKRKIGCRDRMGIIVGRYQIARERVRARVLIEVDQIVGTNDKE